MKRVFCLAAILAGSFTILSCSSGSSSGDFPSFYDLAKTALPSTSSTGDAIVIKEKTKTESFASPRPFGFSAPTSYSTDSSEFLTAFDTAQNYIGQVLLDAGETGPVKSIFVLFAQFNSTIDDINSQFFSGESFSSCTSIASGTSLTIPFFATASTAIFNSWDDTQKYNCYTEEDSGVLAFGRSAIASPSAGCADPYEYYVLRTYGSDDAVNTESVGTRGTTVDIGSVSKYYYNGCSKDFKIAYAQSTRYSAGVEFSSRSEINGNTDAKTFSLRAHYIDADTTYANHITIKGTGQSRVTSEGAAAAYFIMGYRSDNCGTSSDSSTCTLGTALNFCVKNSGLASSYELETTTSHCSALETAYEAITPLVRSDLPSGYFAVGTAALGL